MIYVYDCVNRQIDVICFQHYKPLKADAEWSNTWESSTIKVQIKVTDEVKKHLRCFMQLPLHLIHCLKCRWGRAAVMRGRLPRAAPLVLLAKCCSYIYCVHVNRYSAGIALIRELSVIFMCLFPSYCQYKHCQPCKHTFKKNKEKRCWIKEAHFSLKEESPAKKGL